MLTESDEYDVIKDLNETKCNITFGQLFNSAPKLRTQVSQGLKLQKPENKIVGAVDNMVASSVLVNNIEHSYISKSKEVSDEDIAMVDASVDGIPGKLLIDSCSNLNIITKKYFDQLPNEYEQIGISSGRIRLATSNG